MFEAMHTSLCSNQSRKFVWILTLVTSLVGIAHAAPATRIVGGQDLDISAVPSTVSLLDAVVFEKTADARVAHFCGGTVIARRWVLTAAHCVVNSSDGSVTVTQAKDILVAMGTTNLRQLRSQPVRVSAVRPHPEYVRPPLGVDLALLYLETDADAPIMPLDDDPILSNQLAFTAGWGALNEGGPSQQQQFPDVLQGAGVRMLPYDECDRLFPQQQEQTSVSLRPDQICAGVSGGGVDSCQGDSGGPLYRLNSSADAVVSLLGVVSFGVGCARAEYPGVYSGVGTQLDFIRRIVNSDPAVTPSEFESDNSSENANDNDLLDDLLPGGGGGCTISRSKDTPDPLLPILFGIAGLFVLRRTYRAKA